MPQNVNIAVLAMRADEAEPLLDEVRELLDNAPAPHAFYDKHRHQWRPFRGGQTIRELVKAAEQGALSELHVQLVPITNELYDADDEALIHILDNPCVYVFDCFSLQHPETHRIAREVDMASQHAACLFLVCKTLPQELKTSLEKIRKDTLPRITIRYERHDLRSGMIRPDVQDADAFHNALVDVVRGCIDEIIRRKGAGLLALPRAEEIADYLAWKLNRDELPLPAI